MSGDAFTNDTSFSSLQLFVPQPRNKFGSVELRMRNGTQTFEGMSYDLTKEWYHKLRGAIHHTQTAHHHHKSSQGKGDGEGAVEGEGPEDTGGGGEGEGKELGY